MKKILVILLLFTCLESLGQSIPGYTWINSRYRWFVGMFNGLGLPAGDSAQFMQGQAPKDGAVYFDSTDNVTPAGLYVYYNDDWVLQGQPSTVDLPNALLFGGTVTPLGGYQFAVQAAIYRIDNVLYASDSGTVTIDSSDATLNRIDRIYLARDELIHVLEGELATNALEPQVESDQIGLAFITIPAGSDPSLTTLVVYNENTESTVTNTGTTTDGNNTTNVYVGTKSLNVTNVNNNDQIFLTKAPSLSTWDILGFDGLSGFFKLKAVMPAAGSLRVQLFVGTNAVSAEVIIPIDKSNITTYQAVTIPAAAFGTITNAEITRVRIRYVRAGNTTNYTGFYLDNMFFQDGVVQSGPGGSVTSVGVLVGGNAYVATNTPVTSAGTINITPQGSSGQYINGLGNLVTFPDIPANVGLIGGRAVNANRGMTIDDDSLFLDSVSLTAYGVATPDMYARVYTNTYISNANSIIGDSLIFAKNDSTTGVKLLVAASGITLTDTDSTIVISASGGGGGFFTGSTATANTVQDADGFNFTLTNAGNIQLSANVTGGTNSIVFDNSNNLVISSDWGSDESGLTLSGDALQLHSTSGFYQMTNLNDDVAATKVLVSNGGFIGTQDISGLGGGGSGTVNTGAANRLAYYPAGAATVDDLSAITTNSLLASDANGLPVAVTGVSDTEAGYLNGVTSAIQTQIDSKAPLASPTFTGTVTIPTPFTLGATSVTSTGTQLNYLNAATGTTGTTSSNVVFSATPTFTGTTTIATLSVTGFSTLAGGFATNAAAGNSNMYASGGITANRNTTASILPLSAAGIGLRALINGTTAYAMTANDAFATLDIGTTGGVTEAASGTHPIIASLVVRPITVANGAGATDILVGAYIEGPATGVTPVTASYGLWLDNGVTRLDGSVQLPYTATATSLSADATHYTIDVTATGQTITLPTAVGISGRIYTIKLTASGSGTVATTSSQTIDGSTTYSLASQYKYVTVQSTNANWVVISNN